MIETIKFKALTELGVEFEVEANIGFQYLLKELQEKPMVIVTRDFVNANFNKQHNFFELAAECGFWVEWYEPSKYFILRRVCPDCGEEAHE